MITYSPVLMLEFQFISPEDVDGIVGSVRPTSTCHLDFCSSILVRAARGGLQDWLVHIVNLSLRSAHMQVILKEAFIHPLLKKSPLDPANWQILDLFPACLF